MHVSSTCPTLVLVISKKNYELRGYAIHHLVFKLYNGYPGYRINFIQSRVYLFNWSLTSVHVHFGICEIRIIVMSKLSDGEVNDLGCTTKSIVHPLILKKLWVIIFYVLEFARFGSLSC